MKSLFKLGSTAIVTTSLLALSLSFNSHVTAEEDKASDDNRRICKKYRPTGTRIAKKTCMTKRQWDELKQRAQEAARRAGRLSGQQNIENPLHPGSPGPGA